MTITEIAAKAKAEGAQLIRFRERRPRTIPLGDFNKPIIEYDVKPLFTGSKKGWTLFDSFTGSAIMAVHDQLSADNQSRMDSVALPCLLGFVWKHVSKPE